MGVGLFSIDLRELAVEDEVVASGSECDRHFPSEHNTILRGGQSASKAYPVRQEMYVLAEYVAILL